MKYAGLVTTFCFFSITLFVYGQTDDETIMRDVFLDQVLIKKNHYKSLTIYGTYNENGISKRGGESGKIREVSFNTNGKIVYQVTADNRGNLPFVYYGNGTFVQRFDYNEQGLQTLSYSANRYQSRAALMTYNQEKQLIKKVTKSNDEVILTETFTWKSTTLFDFTTQQENRENESKYEYDNQGRLISRSSPNSTVKLEYKTEKDTLTTTTRFYRADTLRDIYIRKTTVSTKTPFYFLQKNSKQQVVKLMSAKLNVFHHPVTCFIKEVEKKRVDPFTYRTAQLFFENTYAKNGLLTERRVFYHPDYLDEPILTKLEHYFYSEKPLDYEFESFSN